VAAMVSYIDTSSTNEFSLLPLEYIQQRMGCVLLEPFL
jgi:hypothetical protein